ncbi:CHAT domain-containing protein [Sphingomonas sp.]|uniref:CHAT domain-containing protein n=1 Tax=Sphingomonas sp. TaxID=28214 RepID=UPI0035BC021B
MLFDNERAGDDGGTVLDFDMIARVIDATSATPSLLVLVACDTIAGADRFLRAVPAVVAMGAAIGDTAACEFSARFYRSLAEGVAPAKSLAQAKLLLESKGYPDSSLPTLLTRNDAAAARPLI